MSNVRDVRAREVRLYFLPVQMRVPLKFGAAVMTHITYARVGMRVEDGQGRSATGWGETPLSAGWAWPSSRPYEERETAMQAFCGQLARRWAGFELSGHPVEIGHAFNRDCLPALMAGPARDAEEGIPHLAGLVCNSPFDIALHDAYGVLHGRPTYETYSREFMNADLSAYLEPARNASVAFAGRYPCDFLVSPAATRLPVWHLVGGLDHLTDADRTPQDPADGYPVTLCDWIRTDGLHCLKVKLRGNDAAWDTQRLLAVGDVAMRQGVRWLTADFNCTVMDPAYVNEILDRLLWDHPRLYGMILYVEQPFPYELADHQIDVHSVAARKPLFMDESAHDWKLVRLGRSLGWTGVALKTCKTQTGALLSLCWAKAHGMTLMVQDLTNSMLAMVPHALLAAHAGTIMGVEANGMQFHPAASAPESAVHPGLYCRRHGEIALDTLGGPGFGYRLEEIGRELPPPVLEI